MVECLIGAAFYLDVAVSDLAVRAFVLHITGAVIPEGILGHCNAKRLHVGTTISPP